MNKDIEKILKVLKRTYPEAKCDLEFTNSLELLISTMLSAQATDKSVLEVTPKLFDKYKTVDEFSKARASSIEKIIKPVGLSPTKSKNVVATAKILKSKFKGKVPDSREDLESLPGVGRKTANVVLGNFFHKPAIAVDTHVKRISYRLGLTKETSPLKIELALEKILKKREWIHFTHLIIRLGREYCRAKAPRCDECVIKKYCPKKI